MCIRDRIVTGAQVMASDDDDGDDDDGGVDTDCDRSPGYGL